ncbi:MAG: ATP-dependent DNA helicase [Bacillus sp. (in: Bacteria)]|nr:ATP-dependent DNA helicase [Bacillus sp. (in: firmicutes)]
MDNLTKQLKEIFGYDGFRQGQREIIESVLDGRDVLAILPTGAGKTLCYYFPAKLINGITIVVSPLLSLMEDQVHQLRAKGDKQIKQLNSMLPVNERKEILQNLSNETMLFISPEMLMNEYVMQRLTLMTVSLFVVDEAHCISQWGHEFRTDYLRLKEVRGKLNNPRCIALTATATKEVEEDIIHSLGLTNPAVHRSSVNRDEIKLFKVEASSSLEKEQLFFHYINKINSPAIIYTSTRNEAEMLAEKMKMNGQDTVYYHGGMSKEDRVLIQHQFINNEINYICATNAFGMGINKENVRTVIHMHIPLAMEQYVQEIGRAGRDGNTSSAMIFFTKEDHFTPLSFINREFPNVNEVKVWLDLFYQLPRPSLSDLNRLQSYFQIDETKWKMFMYYLRKFNAMDDHGNVTLEKAHDLLESLNNHFQSRKREKEIRFKQLEKNAK